MAAEAGFDTDKGPEYLARYERAFAAWRGRPVKVLELGVLRGGSLLLWADFFPQGRIVGLDLDEVVVDHPRVDVYRGSQGDADLLHRIAAECAPEGFDIVIDDASHLGHYTAASFAALYERHLRPGGIYVLEDWGTGYWETWPDGARSTTRHGEARPPTGHRRLTAQRHALSVAARVMRGRAGGQRLARGAAEAAERLTATSFPSHEAGMVGFVKQLVDLTSKQEDPRVSTSQSPRIREMWISDGQVFCFKPDMGS
jgi:SAM-dependent methyltransferase